MAAATMMIRRGLLAAGVAAFFTAVAATARSAGSRSADRPFARTDEAGLRADDRALPPRAQALVRIGDVDIVRDDPVAMAGFFHPDFRFHGPGGTELDREQLWSYFAACRAAFDDFTIIRQTLVSDGDGHIAARTRFAGRFARPFAGVPGQPIDPNGKPFAYSLLNIFRYAPNGQLIEEWAQYDTAALFDQLRQ